MTIPGSVTSIGDYAFRDCSGLTSVTIPGSVTSIGGSAFYGCSSLTSVTIPNSVTSIGGWAFCGCSGLQEVNFNADNCTSMGSEVCPVFSGCTALTALRIGDNVQRIPSYAFYQCSGLTSVTIPGSVTSIGESAFWGCSGLTSVTIPNSVTTIGERAFYNTYLKSVTIGSGVLSIGSDAFDYSISSYGAPVKVIWLTNTPPSGYSNAAGTVNYVANNLYTSLNNKTVYPFLSSVFEVDGVKYVPVSPSERTCDAIDCLYDESAAQIRIGETVNFKGINMAVKQVHPYALCLNKHIKNVELNFQGNVGNNAFCGCTGVQKVTANNVGNVGISAFYGCTGVQEISIGNNVGNVGDYAFYGCTGIQKVTANNVGNVGSYAFSKITNPFAATINNLGYIGTNAFSGSTGLKTLEIGNAVTNVSSQSFYGCSGLTTARINNRGTLGEKAFQSCTALESATIGDGVTSIGEYCFDGCAKLQSIVIPNAVTTIGAYAFQNCKSMVSAKMGSGVKTINTYTFSGCSALTDMQIGSNVNVIGTYTFNGCSSLQKIEIPKAVTDINNYTFYGCGKLKEVVIADRVNILKLGSNGSSPLFSSCPLDSVYIGGNISYSTSSSYGYSPFYRNTSLRSVMITDKETEISTNEFYGCTNLKNVSIGDGVTTIGDWAFSGCSSLDYFAFGSSVRSIGKEAFSDCTAVTRVISRAGTPPTCGSQALDDINKWTCTLTVPKGHLANYQAADQWKEFFFVEETDAGSIYYTLTYVVDGQEYKKVVVAYGDPITPEPAPTKDGYVFSGWSEIPETMPARNVTVTGTFTESSSSNQLVIGNLASDKGKQVVFPISMNNTAKITGLQLDLYLPDGVTVATNSKGKMLISTTDRMEGTYTISSSQMDGFVRILGYSADGDAFSGNSGDILNVTLNIADNVADGNYTIHVKDIVLSDVNSTEYHPADAGATLTVKSYTLGDVDNSGAININDVVCIINHILNRQVGTFIAEAADVDGSGTININDVVTLINRYILHKSSAPVLLAPALAGITDDNYLHLATISLKPGETKEIEMILTNGNAVAAVQGNVKLPDGVSFVTKSNGRLDVKNIDSRSEDFTLSCALQEDGSMTFAHYSADGFTYDGSDGGIFTFKVKADENAVAGNYNVNLSDVVLSINGVGYELTNRTSTLTVGNGTTGIRSIDNSPLTTDSWYSLDGKKLAGEPTRKGVYIVNGKKVMK